MVTLEIDGVNSLIAVSYTHLDVYKRQGRVFFPTVKSFVPSPLTFDLLLVAVAFTVTLVTLFGTVQLYSVVAL